MPKKETQRFLKPALRRSPPCPQEDGRKRPDSIVLPLSPYDYEGAFRLAVASIQEFIGLVQTFKLDGQNDYRVKTRHLTTLRESLADIETTCTAPIAYWQLAVWRAQNNTGGVIEIGGPDGYPSFRYSLLVEAPTVVTIADIERGVIPSQSVERLHRIIDEMKTAIAAAPIGDRIKVQEFSGGSTEIELDGNIARIGIPATKMLNMLIHRKGERVLGTEIQRECGQRPSELIKKKRFPAWLMPHIEGPVPGTQGYRLVD